MKTLPGRDTRPREQRHNLRQAQVIKARRRNTRPRASSVTGSIVPA